MNRKNKILPQAVAQTIVEQEAAPKSLLLYCLTWNLAGKFPNIESLSYVIPQGYDIYVISTQECGQSISASFYSKSIIPKWTRLLMQYFDDKCGKGTFAMIQNQTLIAINMIIFIKRRTLSSHITHIESQSIPTGIGGIIGNKGGVAISFVYNHRYSFLFINSHFHAHQNNTILRHEDYLTINRNCSLGLDYNKNSDLQATSRFDFIFWMGDLNYRINGNRNIMDLLLKGKQFNVMLQNDQLNIAKDYKQIFDGFIEKRIKFPPTYKYDLNCDVYDTSSKARIPSWTDRILYKTNLEKEEKENEIEFIKNIDYDSVENVKISDHRAVFASFKLNVNATNSPHSHSSINLDQFNDSKSNISILSNNKRNRYFKSMYKYYNFLCFCVCCICSKSGFWRRIFCLRPTRVSWKTD